MSLRVCDAGCAVWVNVRILEESEQELGLEVARDSFVERGLRDLAVFNELQKRLIAIRVGQFNVNARFKRALRRFHFIARHVMQIHKLWDAVIIGSDEAMEGPFL